MLPSSPSEAHAVALVAIPDAGSEPGTRLGPLMLGPAEIRRLRYAAHLPQTVFVEPCARKTALLADVKAAKIELVAIHNAELEALIHEDFGDIEALRARLQIARENKAALIERYREHVTSHGC